MRAWPIYIVLFLPAVVIGAEQTHDELAADASLVVDDAATGLKQTVVTPYLQFEHQKGKNILWCASFQMAWNEMYDTFNGPVHIEGTPAIEKHLNERLITKDDLDKDSYVARFGIGPGIITQIKADLSSKFKNAASPRLLPDTIPDGKYLAYAYLAKDVRFKKPFHTTSPLRLISGEFVKSFGIRYSEKDAEALMEEVVVLYYKSDADFIIELKTIDDRNRLMIARMEPAQSLQSTVDTAMNNALNGPTSSLRPNEYFEVPNLNFDITTSITDLVNRKLLNLPDNNKILSALQNIRFRLDERGALLKSEAHQAVGEIDPFDDAKPRSFICNGPFLIAMMKKGAKMPYFTLWVDNAELLEKSVAGKPAKKGSPGEVDPFSQ